MYTKIKETEIRYPFTSPRSVNCNQAISNAPKYISKLQKRNRIICKNLRKILLINKQII